MGIDRPPTIPTAEYEERRERARAAAREAGLAGLLVWSMGGSTLDSYGDVFYLSNHFSVEPKAPDVSPHWTGFGHACVVLPVEGEPALLVGPPNWRTDLVQIPEVRTDRDLYAETVRCLRDKGLGERRIGISRESLLPLPLYHELRRELPNATLVAADDILERPAHPQEPGRGRDDAARLCGCRRDDERAPFRGRSRPNGWRPCRGRVRRLARSTAQRRTSSRSPPGPTSDNWYWPRLPAYDTTRKYEEGDLLHPDIFGCVDGYFYDFQRSTIVGGRPSAGQREALEAVVELIHHICDELRPGKRACDVHAAGVEWLRETGWAKVMAGGKTDASDFPAFGHGIGVGWEGPWITAHDETVLEPGMTIAIEGAIQRPNVATAVFEEAVLVTEGDPELMTAGCKPRWWD